MKLVIKEIIKETKDAVSLCFKNGNIFKKLSYKPGQFLTIHVPINGTVHKRAYSFSSNPYTEKDLKITIKRVENGLVSNYIHDHLKVGDKLVVDKPAGSFYVEPQPKANKQYVLFAGGSGITPILSIAKSILSKERHSKVLLVYANQDVESIIFHKEIKDVETQYEDAFHVEHILSKNLIELGNYHTGLLTQEVLKKIFIKHELLFDDYMYMICGPFGYMEKVKEVLKYNGITREQIKVEVFKAPEVKLSGKDLLSNVTIKLNNEIHEIKVRGNQSILQKAMSENVPLPYSCRSGMCSSCKGTCTSGEIKMTEGHLLPEEAVANGEILSCVSYPVSENVVVEF